MTITVITKSMGRRSFDSVDSLKDTGKELLISYFTNYTYFEKIRIPMSDIVGFYLGSIESISNKI
jgi:hypothetical protein